MILCHCNLITQRDVEQTIVALLDDDPWQLLVPAKVYHAMGKRGRCCGCFPNVVDTIVRVTEAYHRNRGAAEDDVVSHIDRIREMRGSQGRGHERRKGSHRAA
ncbi:(2Fe-2S)-binding protein [Aquibium sp. A9E412]|uniref:(2Fe-2S)-binding protein n=1 Tax=Aquibium sp. A9E412 TaxID=2976767 RepID=UPI0025AF97EF|nr:(2Fe-2S)-binding protein [Aquibium sp. A9E412]MDN2565911.1 (2Fe-2S)-binding protein [Aquibium sp. A9E412]